MTIKTNKELSQAIDKAISDCGYKRMYISEQLGIARMQQKVDELIKFSKKF